MRRHHRIILALIASVFFLTHCTVHLHECEGPALDIEKVSKIRTNFSGDSGPKAQIIFPNPIESTENLLTYASDPKLFNAFREFKLPDLTRSDSLENTFLKIRNASVSETTNVLVKPSQGEYRFSSIKDKGYTQVLNYFAVQGLFRYFESLGFTLDRSRSIYVLVEADIQSPSVNAYYEHHSLDPSSPRIIRFVGQNSEFPPAADGSISLHEATHALVEFASRNIGLDAAGEGGANYTDASAIHEALADYLSNSVRSNETREKPFLGQWLARSLPGFLPGEPIRWSIDRPKDTLLYEDVLTNKGDGKNPSRYKVATFIERALWDIRDNFVKEDSKTGSIFADRLILASLTQLPRDTSLSDFYDALLKTDKSLHCGLHERSISESFEKRGFKPSVTSLSLPLVVQAEPVGLDTSTNPNTVIPISPGREVRFKMILSNPNSDIARNVIVELSSNDPRLTVLNHAQGLGDLLPNSTLQIGTSTGLNLFWSTSARLGSQLGNSTIPYTIKIKSDNAPETVWNDEVKP